MSVDTSSSMASGSTVLSPAGAQVLTLSSTAPQKSGAERWVAAPFYDILFFIFPTLLSGLFVSMYIFYTSPQAHAILNSGVILLSLIHIMGTWMFFLHKEHFSYYMKQPVKFAIIPALLLIGAVTLGCVEYIKGWQTGIILFVSYVWTHYHLTKQNVGFIGFYRSKMGIKDPAFRAQDVRLIYSYALAAYGYGWYTDPYALGAGLRGHITDYIFGGFACWFIYELIHFCRARLALIREQGLGSWRYFAMMLTALSFPLPMLFLMLNPRPMFVVWGVLTFGLIAHYVQYIAVVALVHWHKDRDSYPSPEGFDESQKAPSFSLRKSGMKGLLVMIILGVAMFGIYRFFLYLGSTSKELEIFQAGIGPGILSGLGFIHVWHDSMIWQPKDEFNRKNTLRFVRPFSRG